MAKTPRPTLDPKLVAMVHGKSNVQFMATKPRRAKRNAANDGRRFQEVVERTAAAYEALGALRLRKVDPPVKIAGGKILFMENPWPDFVGCLNDRRMIALEAKSTSEHRLGFDGDGRLTRKQVDLLIDWGNAGAVSGVLWEFVGNGVCWVPWPALADARRDGAKSLAFAERHAAFPVEAGAGGVEWDFVAHFTQSPPA